LAVAYAGRQLRDLGADVVKVEAPRGDPLRALGPFVGGIPDRDMSGSFAYFNAGKRSVVAHLAPARDPELLALAGRADLILRGTDRGDDWIDDDDIRHLRAADPALIVVDISGFGRQASSRQHPSRDLLVLAAAGFLELNASEPANPKAKPLRYKGELSSVHAGANAVLAALGALFERSRSGLGQHIDISAQAAVAAILATAISRYTYTGVLPVRDGTRSVSPWGFYRCRDGMVLIQCTEDAEFRRLLDIFGDPEWGRMDIFETTAQREAVTDVLDMFVQEELLGMSEAAFLAQAFEHRVPAAPIHFAQDILEWDHLAERGFLGPVRLTDGCRQAVIPVPGPPWRFRGDAMVERGFSPQLGEAGRDVDGIWARRSTTDSRDQVRRDGAVPPPPLSGVRVVDLTCVWAGPHASLQLAHLGADVIRIETSTRVDVTRRLGPFVDDIYGINRSGYFNQYNQGKKSVALNLKTTRGMELLRGLIAKSDVVIDNMSAGALDRMGLSYDELVRINPAIVAVSMTGFGETGPYRDHPAYGSLIDALSGTSSANGVVGGGPTDLTMSLPDPTAGLHAAVATVAALLRARRTGCPVRVECSMLEAFMAAFPWQVIFGGVAGHDAPVMGNRDERRCPHEVFPCHGDDRWIAIVVEDDRQFEALTAVMGASDLAGDPRFRTLDLRRLHESVLEELVASWTLTQDVDQAVAALGAAGVPAEKVSRVDEVLRSPTLVARDFFTGFDHPEFGVRPLAGVAWASDRSPMRAAGAAPVLGQHTREVLTEVLQLSAETVDALIATGVAV
jgi:crotonobetainyl-CoA:carnitine CoA-transferase CaiB-like acyl-CoA transferase